MQLKTKSIKYFLIQLQKTINMSLHSSFGYDSLRSVIFAKAIKKCEQIQNEYYSSESCSDVKSSISSDSEKHIFDREFASESAEPKVVFNNQQSPLSQFNTQQ
ncbi:unnamed protein product (macronuclear) [Paramecium tetraurelia]|uniref:Uncharacterized protein n=1 Tax=Paramecium tetraurelia TaxID=5888 RepID=A0E2N2_PARTE|nr:uncharacterized protein GSPATT00022721001 [Paramecium tetraurelia]CAK89549.1 unnamed protein product [Paramecium tetraurelia]|eukprot:XP_001456946.1 hypothetical protein (macronuclear) [Paramecium tetraurelia strain d4-2]